jgi:hypothetical protein
MPKASAGPRPVARQSPTPPVRRGSVPMRKAQNFCPVAADCHVALARRLSLVRNSLAGKKWGVS